MTALKSTAGRRRVEFRIDMPRAKSVSLVGDFNRWDPKVHPMQRDKDGKWRRAVMVPPGRYEYRFYVDGPWCNDPTRLDKCANCFGTQNDVIIVPTK
jgi:5'-AMP-activated protein kinase regulatory beta subunit